MGFATRQIHEGNYISRHSTISNTDFQTSTLYLTAPLRAQSALQAKKRAISIRAWQSNAAQVAQKVADLENGEAGLVAASGIGAITTAI